MVEEARESIREGESIAQPLRRSGEFPVIVCHMIAVGERSGQLEQMLENVATDYDLEVDMQIARVIEHRGRPEAGVEHPDLPRTWAKARVDALLEKLTNEAKVI